MERLTELQCGEGEQKQTGDNSLRLRIHFSVVPATAGVESSSFPVTAADGGDAGTCTHTRTTRAHYIRSAIRKEHCEATR